MHETRTLHDGGSVSPNIDRKSKTNKSLSGLLDFLCYDLAHAPLMPEIG